MFPTRCARPVPWDKMQIRCVLHAPHSIRLPHVLTRSPLCRCAALCCAVLQEIKTTKVQQKLMSRSIADLQRNATALYGELAADIVSVAAQLAKVSCSLPGNECQGTPITLRTCAWSALYPVCRFCMPCLMLGCWFQSAAAAHCGAAATFDLLRQWKYDYPEARLSLSVSGVQVQKESNQTEDLVLSKVEAMVDARMRRLSQEIAALQVATSASAKREVAVLCLLGLLGAAVALGMPAGGKGSGWVKWVVAALAVSNGAVAVLLQCRAASGWGPVAVLQALPSE